MTFSFPIPKAIRGSLPYFFTLVMLLGGLYMIIVLPLRYNNTANRIADLPNEADWKTERRPTEFVLTGELVDNPILIHNALPIAENELVAYQIHEWEVEITNDGTTGSWEFVTQQAPMLSLRIASKGETWRVHLLPSAKLKWDDRLERIRAVMITGTGREYKKIPDGTLRITGFQNGDEVTVVGQRTDTNTLQITYLYAEDRAYLVKRLKGVAQGFILMGSF